MNNSVTTAFLLESESVKRVATHSDNPILSVQKITATIAFCAIISATGVTLQGNAYPQHTDTIVSHCGLSACKSDVIRLNPYGGGEIMPLEYYKNNKVLTQIASLNYNWNDNGANAFSKELIQKSRNLITSLDKQPMIFPTANDSIQFEYEKENGDYLEFELFENGKCKLFRQRPDNSYEQRFIDPASINSEVNTFYGQQI